MNTELPFISWNIMLWYNNLAANSASKILFVDKNVVTLICEKPFIIYFMYNNLAIAAKQKLIETSSIFRILAFGKNVAAFKS